MSGSERLAELVAEYRGLDRARDAARLRDIFAEAATLVDRQAQPRKWAAFRGMYAQVSEAIDPASALAAYAEALTVWDRDADRDSWADCHMNIGFLLVRMNSMGTPEAEKALQHLELVAADFPWVANTLALLYRYRSVGDPFENWQRQVQYFELALTQVSRENDPAGWAALMNELAICWTAEPGSKFDVTMKKRIEYHQQALDAVAAIHNQPGTPAEKVWIETAIYLNEAYDFLVDGDSRENEQKAEQYARQALAACSGGVPAEARVQALLALGRALVKSEGPEQAARVREALSLYDEAEALINPAVQVVMAANIESFRTASYLKLTQLGDSEAVDKLVAAAESAYALFDPNIYSGARRSVMQQQGDGLVIAGRWSEAIGAFRRAVDAGEAALALANSRQGRLEKIFELRDSSAQMAYCYLQLADIPRALEALDHGKSRFWQPNAAHASFESLASLIPPSGALLFPVFTAAKGAVAVIAETGTSVAHLPDFGKDELNHLLRGADSSRALGGWMLAYAFRNSHFDRWLDQIDVVGTTLYRHIWMPVLEKLEAVGVKRGAELVWFPQAGTNILPMHAAWKADGADRKWLVEDYAIRYSSSVRALLRGAQQDTGACAPPLMVFNPTGDLRFSSMELAWACRSLSDRDPKVLIGPEATEQAVLSALPRATLAHFSTHAAFDLRDPFQSKLFLAGGQELTIDQLLPLLSEAPPQMVVLSACETAMTRVVGTIDEMLGFPGAFLENGTRTVLASLWPVEDSATAVLTGRFYKEHFQEGKTTAQALRAAQNWLRSVTVAELIGLFRELKNDPGPAGAQAARVRSSLLGADPELCPYAHPFFWAALTISGA
jgi:CHAT domain-containing protein